MYIDCLFIYIYTTVFVQIYIYIYVCICSCNFGDNQLAVYLYTNIYIYIYIYISTIYLKAVVSVKLSWIAQVYHVLHSQKLERIFENTIQPASLSFATAKFNL